MCRQFVALAVSLSILGFAAPAIAADRMDGTSWTIKDQKGKTADTLMFKDGVFTSTELIPYGYKMGPYAIKQKGKAVTWTSTQRNDTNDTMQWQGSWDGTSKEMTGTYVRTTGSGTVLDPVKWKASRKKAG
jgi:hypothetical protein